MKNYVVIVVEINLMTSAKDVNVMIDSFVSQSIRDANSGS